MFIFGIHVLCDNAYHSSAWLLLGTRESLSHLIFIILEEQELIVLGHEIFITISVGVSDFQIPKCWGLKFLQNLLPMFNTKLL